MRHGTISCKLMALDSVRCCWTYLPCIYLVQPRQPIIDQQGPGLSRPIHKKASPVAPDFPKEFLALMLGASTAFCPSAFHLLITLFEKSTWQYPWCTGPSRACKRVHLYLCYLCLLQRDRAISLVHFKDLYEVLPIATLFQCS